MKKSKLLVLSLLAVSAIGLTSCGEAGPKGDTGDQGAPGEKGETGAPGKDGVDGKDGTNFLNGEGEPLSSLGKDGDSYLDTLTYDYYVKVSGAWVKKGNIKGEKGEDGATGEKGETGSKGEKGDTGSRGDTGPKGDKGDTAWSNLILSSQYATITPDKGSYKENTTATFTVEFADNLDGYEAFSLLVTNGSETKDLVLKEKVGTKYVYTATVPAGGYVVQADFGSFTIAINKRSNILLVGNVKLTDKVTITKETKIDFNGHSIDVNGKTIEDQSSLELQNSGTKSADNGEIYDSTKDGENTLLSVNGTKVATEVKNQYSEKNDTNAISAFGLDNELERYAEDEESSGKASLTVGKNVSIIANGKGAAIASTGTDSHITIQEDAVVKNTNTTEGKAIEVGGVGEVKIEGKVSSDGGTAVAVTESAKTEENSATITITGEKASVSSTSGTAVEVNAGTVKVENKASVATEGQDKVAVEVKSGNVEITGNVSSSKGTAVKVSETEGSTTKVEVKGGSVSGATAIDVEKGSVTLSSGSVSSTSDSSSAVAVKVSGGSVSVEGATVSSDKGTAIETSKDASLEVTSGTVSGATAGVEVKGGSVAVSGGKVEVATKTGEVDTGTGTAAIKINTGDASAKVDLSGGTIENKNSGGSAISGAESSNVEVEINRGSETGDSGVTIDGEGAEGTEVPEQTATYGSIKSNKTNAIIGENVEFTFTPESGYILSSVKVGDKNYYPSVKDNKVSIPMVKDLKVDATFIKTDDTTSKFVFEAGSGKKVYDSFNAAVEAGETDIKLLSDTTASIITLSGQSLTIDLNGKELNFQGDARIFVKDGSNLVLKGITGSEVNVTKSTFNQSFIKVINNKNSNVNKVNIEKDVTINVKADSSLNGKTVYGLGVFPNDDNTKSGILTKSDVVVNGTINVDGTGLSVLGTITSDLGYSSSDNKITLGSTAKVISTFKGTTGKAEGNTIESMAIYQAGLSEVVVNGGEYSAIDSAIEVRNGKLTINDGTFKSTATSFGVQENGNGKTTTGAALVVNQHTTKGDIEVIVNGGTFTGIKGLYAADVQGNGDEAIAKISIALNGGTFTSTEKDGDAIDVRDGIGCSTTFTDAATLGDIYFAGGDGTEEHPYLIETADQFDNINAEVFKDKSLHYKLTANISLTKYKEGGYKRFILENDTLDLNDCEITAQNYGVIYDGDNAVIKNGTFKAINGGSYALFFGDNYKETEIATGAVLENLKCEGGINIFCAEVEIKGTKSNSVSGTNYYAVWGDEYSEITIDDGIYTSESTLGYAVIHNSKNKAKIVIKGGTFIGSEKVEVISSNCGNVVLEGGTFNQDVSDYVAEGYECIETTKGTWVVSKKVQ